MDLRTEAKAYSEQHTEYSIEKQTLIKQVSMLPPEYFYYIQPANHNIKKKKPIRQGNKMPLKVLNSHKPDLWCIKGEKFKIHTAELIKRIKEETKDNRTIRCSVRSEKIKLNR